MSSDILELCLPSRDGHVRGRATAIITFADGTRAAYKPRTIGQVREIGAFFEHLVGTNPIAMAPFIDHDD